MSCPHLDSIALAPPSPSQSVYREDCTQCFDSIDDHEGLDVCLQCFNGGCAGDRLHSNLHKTTWNHSLALNIRRTRKPVDRDEPPAKISKLAIAAETEEDIYSTSLMAKCLECKLIIDVANPKIAPIVEGIMKANSFSRKEEVKAWEQELTACQHISLLKQSEPREIQQGDLSHCYACDLKENLWLCLECGNLGCGRKQMGGVDGNSHALAHSNESQHAIAVKLGSITPEGNADVYCYVCDDERIDRHLKEHLAHWSIMLAEQQKTEKSLTEMQIEQNLRWDFSMTAGDGSHLEPVFGPGLTGLKNLGNSCYLASIMQCLFDMSSFQSRYYQPNSDLPLVQDPAVDLETQLRKLADGLCSGRYSKPDDSHGIDSRTVHQKGLNPAMLKHLIGRGHPEFSTMRQQDAFEFCQHLFKLITRSSTQGALKDPTVEFRFVLEQRLQCLSCRKVRYSDNVQDNIFIDVPLENISETEGHEANADRYKPVSLKQCIDNFTAPELVELTCSTCGSNDGFSRQSRFKTLPEVLMVNARRMTVLNWVPIKVDVPVIVPEEPFLLDSYLSNGPQPSEELFSDEPSSNTQEFVPDPTALAQLEGMGFPRNRCEKALHATGNSDANSAMEWIFGHMDDPDIDAPTEFTTQPGNNIGASADPEKVSILGAMGFSGPAAEKALRETGGDVERAVEWLFSHPDDQGIGDNDPAGSPSEAAKETTGTMALPAKYQLHSIVCHKGTSIHAGHYVAFIKKELGEKQTNDEAASTWVLFNDEKVVKAHDVDEMRKFAYVYFFKRVT